MGKWKDEDIATPDLVMNYLKEFREGIACNPRFVLEDREMSKVEESLKATEQFCLELLRSRKNKLYMHDLILMAVGFYGGYLTAQDLKSHEIRPDRRN